MLEWQTNYELERIWKGAVVSICRDCGGTRNTSVGTVNLSVGVQSEHLLNKSIERYRQDTVRKVPVLQSALQFRLPRYMKARKRKSVVVVTGLAPSHY
jgi:hypothetical protein